jgi:hypothetical protein
MLKIKPKFLTASLYNFLTKKAHNKFKKKKI